MVINSGSITADGGISLSAVLLRNLRCNHETEDTYFIIIVLQLVLFGTDSQYKTTGWNFLESNFSEHGKTFLFDNQIFYGYNDVY
mgnify:CR=1 FL=1